MRTLCILLLLSLATAREARACDCTIAATDASLRAKAAAIFVGRVLSTSARAADRTQRMQVEVLATWRGVDAGAVVTLTTSASDCGFGLAPGSTMLFFTNARREMRLCAVDQDVRLATAKELAFLGPPKAEVSDAVLATCGCQSAPRAAKRRSAGLEVRAGTPVADGRYAVSIPLEVTRHPRDRRDRAATPTAILSPAGGCALAAPAGTFWFGSASPGPTVHLNRCLADQLYVQVATPPS